MIRVQVGGEKAVEGPGACLNSLVGTREGWMGDGAGERGRHGKGDLGFRFGQRGGGGQKGPR